MWYSTALLLFIAVSSTLCAGQDKASQFGEHSYPHTLDNAFSRVRAHLSNTPSVYKSSVAKELEFLDGVDHNKMIINTIRNIVERSTLSKANDECTALWSIWLSSITNKNDTWAKQVLDAFGKPTSGILDSKSNFNIMNIS